MTVEENATINNHFQEYHDDTINPLALGHN